MMLAFTTFVLSALSLLGYTNASPVNLATVHSFAGTKVASSFIVHLKPTANKATHLSFVKAHFGNTTSLTHTEWSSDLLHGFAGTFDAATIQALRASPDVDSIHEDGLMHTMALTTQTNAPWGIARLSQAGRLSSTNPAAQFTYRFDSSGGAGVDVYVVDTGINTAHTQFGGRARLGAVFGSAQNVDGNGHGSHVSGTVGGSTFGVAKSVSLIAVKVLTDAGSGSVANIVSGLNFVMSSARSSGRPSIATLSLGGSPSTSLDNAITSLVNAGIHVTVAAGNDNADASGSSPARVAVANTIGATTISDARSSFSNFGSVVDIFAPGSNILSSWIGSTTATNTISGTSMATPHIAGLIAYLIARDGNRSPAAMTTLLHTLGTDNALSGIPSGTRNELGRNDE